MAITKSGIVTSNNFFENINPNILVNSFSMPLGSSNVNTGTWRIAGSNSMDRTRVQLPSGDYCFQNSGIQTPNDGSCYGIDSYPTAANSDYVISFDARIVEGTEGYAGFAVHDTTSINGSYTKIDKGYAVTPLTTEWKRCWLHFKTKTGTTRNIYIGVTTGSTSVTTQMRKVKIEAGTYPTPWIPNENDTEYSNISQVKIAKNYLIAKEIIEL